MKKLVAWAIVLTMVCFTMCGCGSKNEEKTEVKEDFIIHSGVKFGDTIEEVKKKETLELSEEEMWKNCLTYKGELVGYPNSLLAYYYDEEEKIYRAVYALNHYNDENKKADEENIYENVYKLMVEKYGKPINIEEHKYLNIYETKDRLSEYIKNEIYDKCQLEGWLLEYKAYYVEIILEELSKIDNYEKCSVEYIYHTKEEIEQKQEKITDREKKAKDDL